MKIFAVSNFGEFVSRCDSDSTEWTFREDCAQLFTSRAKAQALRRRVNRAYGFDRCSVVELRQEDYNEYAWDRFCRYAI